MNKLIMMLAALTFFSCTGSDPEAIPEKEYITIIKNEEILPTVEPTPEVPSEPEYETIEYYEYNNTNCKERDVESCGMVFAGCDDGVVYRCMTNVKYKVKSKEVRVE